MSAYIRTILLADATVAGLVGTRVHPVKLPQDQTMPAVVYTLLDGDSLVSTDGPIGLENPTFQIDCWGSTYATMDALFTAVRKALVGYVGTDVQGIFLVRKRDLYDDDAELYRRTADFSVWHEESV